MDCKRALVETEGNFDKAVEQLQIKKKAVAAKKASRIAAEGLVHSYIHAGGRIGVLCEINCETDFVAKTDKFQDFIGNICMHIAASNPLYVTKEEFSEDKIEAQKRIFVAQVIEEGKPAELAEKIVHGKLTKWMKEFTLLEQQYIRAEAKETVGEYLNNFTADIGEKISIRRFMRYEMGEGLEKRNENFAEEVAFQMG
jgi:elongation factor Ts